MNHKNYILQITLYYNLYPTDYDLLIVQDLQQTHSQIFLIILLKEFIKFGQNNKKCKICGINQKDCQCCLEHKNFKDNLIEYNYLSCNKYYKKESDENLKKRFINSYKFSNHDINMFILLLQKDVQPYEYIDDKI